MRLPLASRLTAVLCIVLGLALAALLFVPYATNGMWFDDSLNSQTWGMVNRFHTTVWDFSRRVSLAWWSNGRILLGWPEIYGFFYSARHVRTIRIADLVMVVGHISLVILLLRKLRTSWPTIGLFVLFLFSMFQIRNVDDPIASYASFCQILGIALTISIILLVNWIRSGDIRILCVSSCLVALSMTFYELNVIYLPIAIFAVLASPLGARRKSAVAVLVPFAIFFGASLYVRHGATAEYSGAMIGGALLIPSTYLKQLSATLPGSFYAIQGHTAFPASDLALAVLHNPLAWLVGALTGVLLFTLSSAHKRTIASVSIPIALGALVLVLGPPALLSVSRRYQNYLTWGSAHIPVYYQYFGMAILAAMGFSRLLSSRWGWLAIAVTPVFAVFMALNWTVNLHQSAYLDNIFSEPRSSLAAALHDGLFDEVKNGDVIEINDQPPFINGNLIYQEIERNVSIPNELAIAGWYEAKPVAGGPRFRLYRDDSLPRDWKLLAIQ